MMKRRTLGRLQYYTVQHNLSLYGKGFAESFKQSRRPTREDDYDYINMTKIAMVPQEELCHLEDELNH